MPNFNFRPQFQAQLGALQTALQRPQAPNIPQFNAPQIQAPQMPQGQFSPFNPQFGQNLQQFIGSQGGMGQGQQPMVPYHPIQQGMNIPRPMVPLPQPKMNMQQPMGMPKMPSMSNDNGS